MEIQEMGVDGQGIRETGGSASDHIFFMKYPIPSVVFKYWTLVSDDLIPHDRNSGQYTATFK
jgi:hypothetical protein